MFRARCRRLLACCLLTATRPFEYWRRLEPWARWTVVAVAPLAFVTPILNGTFDSNALLPFAPLTIVLVEQNFRFAAPLADRFYVMEHGRIAQAFSAPELDSKTGMLHEYLGV